MKTLELTGLDNYIGPLVKGNKLIKGNVVRVDDKVADHMLIGEEMVKGAVIPHFTVVDDSRRADFDFVTEQDSVGTTSEAEPASQTGLTEAKPAKAHAQRAPRTAK